MHDDDDYCEHKQITSRGICLGCGEYGHLAPGDEEGVLPNEEED